MTSVTLNTIAAFAWQTGALSTRIAAERQIHSIVEHARAVLGKCGKIATRKKSALALDHSNGTAFKVQDGTPFGLQIIGISASCCLLPSAANAAASHIAQRRASDPSGETEAVTRPTKSLLRWAPNDAILPRSISHLWASQVNAGSSDIHHQQSREYSRGWTRTPSRESVARGVACPHRRLYGKLTLSR
jgi:hypothetical protein